MAPWEQRGCGAVSRARRVGRTVGLRSNQVVVEEAFRHFLHAQKGRPGDRGERPRRVSGASRGGGRRKRCAQAHPRAQAASRPNGKSPSDRAQISSRASGTPLAPSPDWGQCRRAPRRARATVRVGVPVFAHRVAARRCLLLRALPLRGRNSLAGPQNQTQPKRLRFASRRSQASRGGLLGAPTAGVWWPSVLLQSR